MERELARAALQHVAHPALITFGIGDADHRGERLAGQITCAHADAFRHHAIGKAQLHLGIDDEHRGRLAVRNQAQQPLLPFQLLRHGRITPCRVRRASRRAMAPHRDQHREAHQDRQHQRHQHAIEPRIARGQRLAPVDLVDERPARRGNRAAGRQDRNVAMVAQLKKSARPLDRLRLGQARRVRRQPLVERRRAVDQRRQEFDDRAGLAHEHGFEGSLRCLRPRQQREQLAVHFLDAQHDADLPAAGIGLHREKSGPGTPWSAVPRRRQTSR